jgi:hypothetical protein
MMSFSTILRNIGLCNKMKIQQLRFYAKVQKSLTESEWQTLVAKVEDLSKRLSATQDEEELAEEVAERRTHLPALDPHTPTWARSLSARSDYQHHTTEKMLQQAQLILGNGIKRSSSSLTVEFETP